MRAELGQYLTHRAALVSDPAIQVAPSRPAVVSGGTQCGDENAKQQAAWADIGRGGAGAGDSFTAELEPWGCEPQPAL